MTRPNVVERSAIEVVQPAYAPLTFSPDGKANRYLDNWCPYRLGMTTQKEEAGYLHPTSSLCSLVSGSSVRLPRRTRIY